MNPRLVVLFASVLAAASGCRREEAFSDGPDFTLDGGAEATAFRLDVAVPVAALEGQDVGELVLSADWSHVDGGSVKSSLLASGGEDEELIASSEGGSVDPHDPAIRFALLLDPDLLSRCDPAAGCDLSYTASFELVGEGATDVAWGASVALGTSDTGTKSSEDATIEFVAIDAE